MPPTMEIPSIQDLVGLPEAEARRQRFLAESSRSLRYMVLAISMVGLLFIVLGLMEGSYTRLIGPGLALVLARWVWVYCERPWFRRYFMVIAPLVILAALGLVVAMVPDTDMGLRLIGLLGVILLATGFRLPWQVHVLIFGVLWVGTLGPPTWQAYRAGEPILGMRALIQTAATIAGAYFALTATARDTASFVRRYRIESSRNRERLRMREELDSARQIQLSMLPRRDPKLEGLTLAAVSLPATEVGGDYYEYFLHDKRHFTLVVGDVAGHGVASGLMLSGLRSCLHLMQSDLPTPADSLEKLHYMVRQTTDPRMFITLLFAAVDTEERVATVATGGHPPLLHYDRAANEVREIGIHAPPLGTVLESRFFEQEVRWNSGDVLIAYTDGVTETANSRGELYGDERLQERLSRVGQQKSAREIREALLSDVWTWKGDAEQLDDITLVVLRAD